jgi:DNA-binding CsgD family transcriptional regulator
MPAPDSFKEAGMKATPPPKLKWISATETTQPLANKKFIAPNPPAGLLLMDSSLNPISFNAEAIQILSYPDNLANRTRPSVFLSRKVRSSLISQQSSAESPFVTEFRSGRRQYFCRAFVVDSTVKDTSHPSIAVLLERGPSELASLPQVTKRFNLTPREGEVLMYLVWGLSSKEIADRMSLSPNTVKAFLRLIMSKMEVSSRSAIVVKVLMIQQQ